MERLEGYVQNEQTINNTKNIPSISSIKHLEQFQGLKCRIHKQWVNTK